MSDRSGIEWTDATWTPVVVCQKVSPGCANCYAEAMAKRLRAMGQEKYAQAVDDKGHWTGVPWFGDEALLGQPLRWKKPRRIFVCSMADLFHEAVPFEFIKRVFDTMQAADWHTFQVLTKRPGRAAEFFLWLEAQHDPRTCDFGRLYPHIWIGTSVEDQKRADERIPYLLKIPAAVRYLSVEPLLGPVDLWSANYKNPAGGFTGAVTRWPGGVQWVIVGGESGPNARPMHPDWARGIRDQCQGAGIPFFFKQWGEWIPYDNSEHGDLGTRYADSHNRWQWLRPDGYEGAEWRNTTTMLRVGKHVAGRLFDGREWNEFPQLER